MPLITKTGVTRGLEMIIKKTKMIYRCDIHTDNGIEYYSRYVRELLKGYCVKHYSTYSENNLSILIIVHNSSNCRTIKLYAENSHVSRL